MKRSPLVVIFTTVFIDLLGFGIVIPVLPFYAEGTRFNATPRTVGFLFASYSIMQLIFSPILGRLSDKYGRRPVLLISIIGTGIGVGYTVALANDDLVSIQFDVGSYESGAAHPNSYSEVLNFDLKNGRQLKLSDLFQPGSKYLQALSAYAIKDLKRQSRQQGDDSMFDDDWIQRGAGADAENFSSWTIGKKGLGITFDSYQVAPYAAGPQSVFVPYSALKDIIKPDGPVGQFAN